MRHPTPDSVEAPVPGPAVIGERGGFGPLTDQRVHHLLALT